jgi:hypothetical protein
MSIFVPFQSGSLFVKLVVDVTLQARRVWEAIGGRTAIHNPNPFPRIPLTAALPAENHQGARTRSLGAVGDSVRATNTATITNSTSCLVN